MSIWRYIALSQLASLHFSYTKVSKGGTKYPKNFETSNMYYVNEHVHIQNSSCSSGKPNISLSPHTPPISPKGLIIQTSHAKTPPRSFPLPLSLSAPPPYYRPPTYLHPPLNIPILIRPPHRIPRLIRLPLPQHIRRPRLNDTGPADMPLQPLLPILMHRMPLPDLA